MSKSTVFTAILLPVLLVAGFSACSGDDTPAPAAKANTSAPQKPSPTPAAREATATKAAAASPAERKEATEAAFTAALDCDTVVPRDQWLPEDPSTDEMYSAAIGCAYNDGSAVIALLTKDHSTASLVRSLMRDQMPDYRFTTDGAWMVGASDSATLAAADEAYREAVSAS